MRPAAVLAILLLVPLAFAGSRGDPAGDEEITLSAGNLNAICSDPAGDIVGFTVESDGSTMRATLSFLDASAPLDCLGQPLGLDVTRAAGLRFVGDGGTATFWYFQHTNGRTETCVGETCSEVAPGAASWDVPITPSARGTHLVTAFIDSFHTRDNSVVLRSLDRTGAIEVTL